MQAVNGKLGRHVKVNGNGAALLHAARMSLDSLGTGGNDNIADGALLLGCGIV